MNRLPPAIIALGLAASTFVSCSSTKTAMKKVSAPVKGLTKMNANDWKMFKLRDLRGNTPPVVQVRQKDLKKMSTGEEKYLAWHRSRNLAYTSADGTLYLPEDFDPSSLTDGDLGGTFGVLPALPSSNDDLDKQPSTPSGELPKID